MNRLTTALLTAATVALCGGYYALADALDLTPGLITAAPHDLQPAAPPSVPGLDATIPQTAALPADAPLPDSETVTSLIAQLSADPRLAGGNVGVSIVDVASSSVIASSGGETPMVPASSIKLLTGYAALAHFGGDHRLQTTATFDGATLTLVGGGDTLLSPGHGASDSTVGHAGLADLAHEAAQALRAQGVQSVPLALDDTLITGASWHDTWEEDYHHWVGPIAPLMLDVTAYTNVTGYPADPAMDAARAFAAALADEGITVSGDPYRAASPTQAQVVGTVESAPLSDILAVSLKASDNTMTEVEGRLLAADLGYETTFAGASQAVRDVLSREGIDVSGVTMVDCSGLSPANAVAPQVLASLLVDSASDSGPHASIGRMLIEALPVASLDGTLAERFEGTSGAGMVRAKTGSLEHVSSLSGVLVTGEGRLLAFSVIVNNAQTGPWGLRAAIDEDLIAPLAR